MPVAIGEDFVPETAPIGSDFVPEKPPIGSDFQPEAGGSYTKRIKDALLGTQPDNYGTQGLPKPGESVDQFTQRTGGAEDDFSHTPYVSSETIGKGLSALGEIGATSKQDLQPSPIEGGINKAIAERVSGLTSPDALVELASFLSPGYAEAQGAAGMTQVPGDVSRIKEALQKGDSANAAENVTGTTVDAVMNALMLGHRLIPKGTAEAGKEVAPDTLPPKTNALAGQPGASVSGTEDATDPKTPDLQPQPPSGKVPSVDEFAARTQESPTVRPGDEPVGQQQAASESGVARPENKGVGESSGQSAGTSNRIFTQTYGEESVPAGEGVDTGELLDNARAAIRSGDIDPYSVLSKTRAKGIANPEEYAALAAEHERLVNQAVALEKTGDPAAGEAAQQANDFATAIQPHKTAASDLMRLFQGDLNYDLSTTFGIDQYMKAELGRGMKPSEEPLFNNRAQGIRQAETDVSQAVTRSDARVRSRYAKVRDIPIEEAAARVKQLLSDCLV